VLQRGRRGRARKLREIEAYEENKKWIKRCYEKDWRIEDE
jgi:hypothetical protein